ncbi:MAG: hypothetical protein GF329_16215 [Candidatus Lokiarchaeota archaeon]|nr:hypothetical protein [Candidatus Lokiarchaeota archaeon]
MRGIKEKMMNELKLNQEGNYLIYRNKYIKYCMKVERNKQVRFFLELIPKAEGCSFDIREFQVLMDIYSFLCTNLSLKFDIELVILENSWTIISELMYFTDEIKKKFINLKVFLQYVFNDLFNILIKED